MAQSTADVDVNRNHDAETISVAIVFSLLGLLAVAARITSKRLKQNPIAADDFLLMASWLVACGEASAAAAATRYGTKWQSQAEIKIAFAVGVLNSTTLALSKLSLLILLSRIFTSKRFKLTMHIFALVIVCWWIATILCSTFTCALVDSIWTLSAASGCVDSSIFTYVVPIPWVLTDFTILMSPIPIIRKLQVVQKKRRSLYFMFLFGGITCIISVIRYALIIVIFITNDTSYNYASFMVLSIVETQVTVMCSALVACQPAISALMPRRLFYRISVTQSASERHNERVHPFHSLPEHHALQPPIPAAQIASRESAIASYWSTGQV